MPHSRKHSGAWKETTPYRKVNGVWQPAQERFRKHSGAWKSCYINETVFADCDSTTGWTDNSSPNGSLIVDTGTKVVGGGSIRYREYDDRGRVYKGSISDELYPSSFISFYVRVSVPSSSSINRSIVRLLGKDGGASAYIGEATFENGVVQWYHPDLTTNLFNYTNNNWYFFELRNLVLGSAGGYDLYVDGALQMTVSFSGSYRPNSFGSVSCLIDVFSADYGYLWIDHITYK